MLFLGTFVLHLTCQLVHKTTYITNNEVVLVPESVAAESGSWIFIVYPSSSEITAKIMLTFIQNMSILGNWKDYSISCSIFRRSYCRLQTFEQQYQFMITRQETNINNPVLQHLYGFFFIFDECNFSLKTMPVFLWELILWMSATSLQTSRILYYFVFYSFVFFRVTYLMILIDDFKDG